MQERGGICNATKLSQPSRSPQQLLTRTPDLCFVMLIYLLALSLEKSFIFQLGKVRDKNRQGDPVLLQGKDVPFTDSFLSDAFTRSFQDLPNFFVSGFSCSPALLWFFLELK